MPSNGNVTVALSPSSSTEGAPNSYRASPNSSVRRGLSTTVISFGLITVLLNTILKLPVAICKSWALAILTGITTSFPGPAEATLSINNLTAPKVSHTSSD